MRIFKMRKKIESSINIFWKNVSVIYDDLYHLRDFCRFCRFSHDHQRLKKAQVLILRILGVGAMMTILDFGS